MRSSILTGALAALIGGCADDVTGAGMIVTPPCRPIADGGASSPLARPILGLDPADMGANRALLPPGFAGAEDTACSTDPTRGYLAELGAHSVTDSRVPYEWAPVVPGNLVERPVIGQPEFFVAGEARAVERSTSDLPFDHPFGLDTNFDVHVDPEFVGLVHAERPSDPIDVLHAEIDEGLLPGEAFGFPLRDGDRVLMKGAWILDCGHPPYGAEMHPPTFVSAARAVDGVTTESLALVNPFRVAQVFSHDADAVTDFANDARFMAASPFPAHLVNEVTLAALNRSQRLEVHALLEATRFDTIRWQVCAPSPRPAGSALGYTYRFTMRTGVTVAATPIADTGCVRFTATMGPAYRPFVPMRSNLEYPWDQISRDASQAAGTSIDVRDQVLAALRSLGLPAGGVAFQAATAPYIDSYTPLAPRAGADRSTPTALVRGADDQAFPFYGRVTVRWCGR